jgi:plasmid maintenance system killer protein
MIVSFRHKGLKLLFEKGDRRRVLSHHVEKIERNPSAARGGE